VKLFVTLEPGEDAWIVAECPSIPGCVSQGKTREEALKNISEAIALCIQARSELGLPAFKDVAEVEVAV
jgi:predicted RNase H-like HicB family nuclease